MQIRFASPLVFCRFILGLCLLSAAGITLVSAATSPPALILPPPETVFRLPPLSGHLSVSPVSASSQPLPTNTGELQNLLVTHLTRSGVADHVHGGAEGKYRLVPTITRFSFQDKANAPDRLILKARFRLLENRTGRRLLDDSYHIRLPVESSRTQALKAALHQLFERVTRDLRGRLS